MKTSLRISGRGTIGYFIVERHLHFRIASGDGVADHHQIGAGPEMGFGKPLEDRDAPILQEGGHGRIDIPVGAGDTKPLLLEHARQRGHPRAADSDQVDVSDAVETINHRQIFQLRRPIGWGIPPG